jgi:NAD+ synthetase
MVSADLHLFGELSLTGYYAQDVFFNTSVQREVENCLVELENISRETCQRIGIGFPGNNVNTNQKPLFNTFGLFGENGFLQNKVCLPTYKEFDENRWFQSGDDKQVHVRQIGDEYVGFLICEDGWNSPYGGLPEKYRLYEADLYEKLFEEAKTLGVRLSAFINISASPDYIGKQKIRVEVFSRVAKHYKTPLVFVNLVGAQDELVFGGRSFVINANGELVLELKGFVEDSIIINTQKINSMPVIYRGYDSMQELDEMIGCYLKGYFRKAGLNDKKAILGLSGGKDSTAVAVALKRHLGADKVVGVMMPYKLGKYTARLSKQIAERLAVGLGIEVREVVIDDMVEPVITTLNLRTDSLAHQNVQARVRANVLWAIANEENGIVINTTNFSEAAVGYGTIGGDLLGLPLIASIPATMVIKYLEWLKENGEEALDWEMINRPPSAELIPGQLDADELGDYEYIDPILESLRMNYGDNQIVRDQLLNKKEKQYIKYWSDTDKFDDKLRFLSRKLINQSEFKRWYYNRTPQLTPFSWLRWKWPLANAEMNNQSEPLI